jgi:hypothetical protein
MGIELYIHIHPDVTGAAEDILEDFPYEPGQTIVSFTGGIIVIDLQEAEDTNYLQDWYLNSNDDVQSFYVVE